MKYYCDCGFRTIRKATYDLHIKTCIKPKAQKLIIEESGIWDLSDNVELHHAHDKGLEEELLNFFIKKNESVVDLGCGLGNYVKALKNNNIEVMGYDGNPNTKILTNNMCDIIDLSKKFKLDKYYDWVMSLEVGEHLPKKYEDIFINNLHNNNKLGIILSWASIGQGGEGHVNEQNEDYIKSKFINLGYINDIETETKFRNASKLSWFKNTIMVFRKNNMFK